MNGKFLHRDVKHMKNWIEVAQTHKILNILDVGTTSDKIVSVIQVEDDDGRSYLKMVTRGFYDMMDFATEEELKAYHNLSRTVINTIGVYSNKYKVR